jgi:hypothetical protein
VAAELLSFNDLEFEQAPTAGRPAAAGPAGRAAHQALAMSKMSPADSEVGTAGHR